MVNTELPYHNSTCEITFSKLTVRVKLESLETVLLFGTELETKLVVSQPTGAAGPF